MKVLVTGSNGFVGDALVRHLYQSGGFDIAGATRVARRAGMPGCTEHVVGNLGPATDWRAALSGVDVVVHTAARVHLMHDAAADPFAEYRTVNVAGTLHLAEQSALLGVRRFIFLSSVKVNGEQTRLGHPFQVDDPPAPVDDYGFSKMEAESGLRAISEKTGLEVVIIRPPLVYGPGVKANFGALLRLLSNRVPLPFGAVYRNRRSFVALDNLVDLIVLCLSHTRAANQIFLVSDGEDLSTKDLFERLAHAMHKPAVLFPVPPFLLTLAGKALGREIVIQRLLGTLQVNSSKTHEILEWRPPITVNEGMKRAVALYFVAH